jgi:RNA polymerase sigma-70 factor (ECF subfamily)
MNVNPLYHKTENALSEELNSINKAKEDPSAFAPLYKEYHEKIFRYVYQRMNDKDLAFDITSQVFIKAMNNIHKYEYRGVPFSSWLYRIAKSELYQSFRNKKAERVVNFESYHLIDVSEEIDCNDLVDKKELLIEALSKLKDIDIQLVEMRFFEKRSYREMGDILDLTENNAKVKTFRALERLKKLVTNK